MTIEELLEYLDGLGLVVTDWDGVYKNLFDLGLNGYELECPKEEE